MFALADIISYSQADEILDANFMTEIRAGLTTFATMAYIIAVNVGIIEISVAVFC